MGCAVASVRVVLVFTLAVFTVMLNRLALRFLLFVNVARLPYVRVDTTGIVF